MTVQNDSIEFRRDSLPIFADHSVAFGRTGTRFSNYEHFYLLMNNSGLMIRLKFAKYHDITGKMHFSENVMVFLYDFLYTVLKIFKERNFLQ